MAYIHFKYTELFPAREGAEEHLGLLSSIVSSLEQSHKVFIRLAPVVEENRSFAENEEKWLVAARFSVGAKA